MVPQCAASICDLKQGDFVVVECACGHKGLAEHSENAPRTRVRDSRETTTGGSDHQSKSTRKGNETPLAQIKCLLR
jgi:hypothetical protein